MMTTIPIYDWEKEDDALIVAAQAGHHDDLASLLAAGYYVNKSNFDSVTALHEASLAAHFRCMQILLEAGANVNAQNIDGATPLCDASNSGDVECVRLLLRHGARVNLSLNVTSALHEALLRNHSAVVQLLVDSGAKLECQDLHYGSPLHVAAFKDHAECAAILLKAGANVNAAKTHQMALHHASANASINMVRLLLDFGANIFAENANGQTALSLVDEDSELFSLLYDHRCTPLQLQQRCRLVIRSCVTAKRLSSLHNLAVPKRIQRFLCYM